MEGNLTVCSRRPCRTRDQNAYRHGSGKPQRKEHGPGPRHQPRPALGDEDIGQGPGEADDELGRVLVRERELERERQDHEPRGDRPRNHRRNLASRCAR